MSREDDLTQPLPAAGSPDAQSDAASTEPLIAPHVPVADVGTAMAPLRTHAEEAEQDGF